MSEKVVCIYFNFRELMATFKKKYSQISISCEPDQLSG